MEAYTGFASVYDRYMDNVPYDTWAENIKTLFNKFNMPMEIVCDLGCGTGQITRRLKAAGYDMIGIDVSYDMLMEAMAAEDSEGILYLCQDMREFELYGTVGAVVSLCDSMNYLRNYEELLTVCKLANNYLDPKGLFIFDVKTEHFYQQLGTSTIAENREEGSFIWENDYDSSTRDNAYYLTIYEENEDGTFDRYEEEHLQHAFTIEEIKAAIKESGLELLDILDVATMSAPAEDSDRLYFIAREVTK
ncbi:class I SAM-dependent DNA methyltransferase [Pseudobutyrivibrio xylanivorans]|uniref:Methyltransferase domain-containing protein n=1 Tax=Pseudobutyrivibrio xylanivorans DSM 14809 TaxID=1123012 RepID=A0A1M6ILQ7_PSEXY|nr:methyltransferase domain-containing protein [Pseudobutyrivibrio xylanivorans]SHJ35380.1 Methyltransferase domain-containing protein [Pseudobutyrivibrio xylanivorans DSM 14809]